MRQDAFEYALRVVVAQASVRTMNVDEIVALTKDLTSAFTDLIEGRTEKTVEAVAEPEPRSFAPVMDPKKSVKDNSVTCLVCGEKFKVLSAKHLAQHGFASSDGYCEYFGLRKGTALVCKSLQKMRREKMASMKLWERRIKKAEQPKEESVGQPEEKTVVVRKRAPKQTPAG